MDPPVVTLFRRPRPEEDVFRIVVDSAGGDRVVGRDDDGLVVVVGDDVNRFDRRRFPCPASPCPRPMARFNTRLTRGSSFRPE